MKATTAHNKSKLARRHARIRAVVSGTAERPRLAVSRSNLYITAQVIDDTQHKTLVAIHDKTQKGATKTERAFAAGQALAKACAAAKITHVAFDRGGYQYHGRIKAFADGAREAGLQF